MSCPYCGESIELAIDGEADGAGSRQQYIEDCQVCCRPMVVSVDNGQVHVFRQDA